MIRVTVGPRYYILRELFTVNKKEDEMEIKVCDMRWGITENLNSVI